MKLIKLMHKPLSC